MKILKFGTLSCMKIPFSPPYIDKDVIDEVSDSLQSGWITTGPKTKALEEMVADYAGIEHTVAVNSWTSGAIMILKWFGVKEGDEVIVPAYTYCATAMAVLEVGAKPIMVDIGDDFTLLPEAVRKAITPRTKAIIPVDFGGWPCRYDELYGIIADTQIVEQFHPASEMQRQLGRILLIADAAHSLGAIDGAKKVGALADITIFSLHAVKNITAAEGGIVCLNMPAPFDNGTLYRHLRMMTLNGQSKDALSKSKAGSWQYDILFQGLKINLPDVNAAIALSQMRKYNFLLGERRRVYEQYILHFSKYDWAVLPPFAEGGKISACQLFALRINGITEEERNAIVSELSAMDIAVNVHFIPMPMLTLFRQLGYDINDFPVSYDTYSREISLPVYPQLTNEAVDFVVQALISAYKKVVPLCLSM